MANQLIYLLQSLRLKQWIKNFFIFAPLIFSGKLFQIPLLIKTIQVFFLFSFLASGNYLINDLLDLKKDRVHPEKRKRPLASGRLKVPVAVIGAILLLTFPLIESFLINNRLGAVFVSYFLLILFYSLFLKKFVIIDVFVIAIGFILRVAVGTIAISVPISDWILICTLFLALFLGFCKRRHELALLSENNTLHRASLGGYSPYLLDQMIAISTTSTILSYTLYTVSPETIRHIGTDHLLYTVPFVIYGIFRYLFLVHKKNEGGSPTEIVLKDKAILITIFLWALAVCLILYGKWL